VNPGNEVIDNEANRRWPGPAVHAGEIIAVEDAPPLRV
jgi:hypothetical protein